jgi:hypothetical protein
LNIKKTAGVVVILSAMLATSGCLTAEFWNCCLFGQNPTTAVGSVGESTIPEDLKLPRVTRHVVTPVSRQAMGY